MKKSPHKKVQQLPPTNTFPMRINKYLAWKKHSTRRGADELIAKRQVLINGEIAVLGDKVLESDVVEVRFRKAPPEHIYFAYNKPKGIVSHSAQTGEKDVQKALGRKDIFPLGRLDKDSHGLMILTNDGRITDSLLNPEFEHDKEYIVETSKKLRDNFKEKIEAGLLIEGYKTKPCKVQVLDENTFRITLTEGKKHQIRRMVVALFNDVRDLKRVRIMNISLGSLKEGTTRKLEGDELKNFLSSLGF